MVARLGRPVSDNSKSYMLRVRMSDVDLQKLDFLCNTEKKSRSEVIRDLIQEQYETKK